MSMRFSCPGLAAILALSLAALLWARPPVRARHGMVVAQEPIAADIGVEVLQSGGNVIDAAVAVGFALAVTHPAAGNIGGGGFLLARFADGETFFLDFRERAPAKAHRDMYLDENRALSGDSRLGWRAAGVPGTVKGLEHAHRRYGRKEWKELLAPAVRLARDGFRVSWPLARSLESSSKLSQFPESKRIFQKDGAYYQAGDTFRQPELAGTLARIAEAGTDEFYSGETARRLVREMELHGGLIGASDLAGYSVVEREPLRGDYRGNEILCAPPPSSGGAGLLQMLGILEGSAYRKSGAGSAASIHFVAETMRRYFADRNTHLADPAYHCLPLESLLEPAYIRSRRESIDRGRATSSETIGPGSMPPPESGETTHISIADSEGNAVALTYTINGG